jgi:hypothetical protein
MSFRLEMLQVARVAPKVLGDASALVANFLRGQLTAEGAFIDRAGRADLYYTVFGIEGMLALQQTWPKEQTVAWLRGFGAGETLDFVHVCCLARCWAALKHQGIGEDTAAGIAERLEAYAATEGGYHVGKGREWGSAYGCLLAAAAYEDLKLPLPRLVALQQCMEGLRTNDGAWNNERHLPLGTAPATAAAISLYRRMGWPVPQECVAWLLQCFLPEGGCRAFPAAPMPDLLSTAVALHGLNGAGFDLRPLQESCLDYIDSLWSNEGGFHGNWTDHALDCEYTYYGLLALGHLA